MLNLDLLEVSIVRGKMRCRLYLIFFLFRYRSFWSFGSPYCGSYQCLVATAEPLGSARKAVAGRQSLIHFRLVTHFLLFNSGLGRALQFLASRIFALG